MKRTMIAAMCVLMLWVAGCQTGQQEAVTGSMQMVSPPMAAAMPPVSAAADLEVDHSRAAIFTVTPGATQVRATLSPSPAGPMRLQVWANADYIGDHNRGMWMDVGAGENDRPAGFGADRGFEGFAVYGYGALERVEWWTEGD